MLRNLKCSILLYLRMCNPPDVDVGAAKHYIASYASCLCKQCNALQTFVTFASVMSKVGYRLPTNMASPDHEPPRRQYDCVCLKYGSGKPHKISHTAWYQHLASACTEEERQRIQTVRLLGDRIVSPHLSPNLHRYPIMTTWCPPAFRGLRHAEDLPSRPGKTMIPTNMWVDGSVRVCVCNSPSTRKLGPQIMGTR